MNCTLRSRSLPTWCASAMLLVVASTAALPARAQGIDSLAQFRNDVWKQTDSGTVTPIGSFFGQRANTYSTELSGGVFSDPFGNSFPLTLAGFVTDPVGLLKAYDYQTGYFANRAAMDAAFGLGTYRATLTGSGTTTAGASITADSLDRYANNLPQLSGDSFSRLQGADAATDLTVTFDATNNLGVTGVNGSYIFFKVMASDGAVVFARGFQPDSLTSVTIPAQTLLPGASYRFDLDYSNRTIVPAEGGAVRPGTLAYDVRVFGNFATAAAVPEPQSLWLMAVGGLALVAWKRRRA